MFDEICQSLSLGIDKLSVRGRMLEPIARRCITDFVIPDSDEGA
ncbi:hypothetical protein VCR26J2_150367 [Vibrio coralliirubri]|nr:hypothetical protein VCR1J2_180012 [Vibrio coralliirubri]CDT43601.1 hypothetical protein VCR26J2_150367 [Vibrio coralliirubri]